MDIKEIFERFEKVGSCVFSTVADGMPTSRVAHFLTCDEGGLYFTTMDSKPFYRQLRETGKVAVLALAGDPGIVMGDDRELVMKPGWYIRIAGDVREVSRDDIINKNSDGRFDFMLEDMERYPRTRAFAVYRFKGEIYDYDYDRVLRDHKLERERFLFDGAGAWGLGGDGTAAGSNGAFGAETGITCEKAGLYIDPEKCIGCEACKDKCSFDAVIFNEDTGKCEIPGGRCDECGNCTLVCPVDAILDKGRGRM